MTYHCAAWAKVAAKFAAAWPHLLVVQGQQRGRRARWPTAPGVRFGRARSARTPPNCIRALVQVRARETQAPIVAAAKRAGAPLGRLASYLPLTLRPAPFPTPRSLPARNSAPGLRPRRLRIPLPRNGRMVFGASSRVVELVILT